MLYLISGNDTEKSRKRFREILNSFQPEAGRPGAGSNINIFKINSDNFSAVEFNEFPKSQGLFSKKYLVACDNLLENEDAEKIIGEKIDEISESENIFVFLENSSSDTLKKLEKTAKKTETFKKEKKEEKRNSGFNIFSLSDALGEGDRKKLWVVYQKALRAGLEADFDVFWKFAWQLKMMMIAKASGERAEKAIAKLGIKPFVLTKARQYAKNYSEDGLKRLFGELMQIYHDVRRGKGDYELDVEKFVLNLPQKA